ncbi:p25-alpha-domain-containing protein [Obelidium mucronatum]|nr:p25-alpha-domain-containing protein [Obelidium mucronatum]
MAATVFELRNTFERFCAFGRGSVGSSLDSLTGGSTMDGAKWAKFARDSNLIDNKKITSTEIDIIFNKVKAKNSRRIDWEEFQAALKMVAEKKYAEKHAQDAFTQVMYDVCVRAHGPVSKATAVQKDAVLDRLTDVNGYTGSHKNRFDSAGRGLGLQGRDTISRTDTLGKIVSRDIAVQRPSVPQNSRPITTTEKNRTSTVASGKRQSVLTQSEERLENITNAPKKTPVAGRRATQQSANYTTSSSLASSQQSLATKNSSVSSSKASVFDRLTNTKDYTGAHKHRFNADGTGRGLAGRDSAPLGSGGESKYRGGDVKDLKQILRT